MTLENFAPIIVRLSGSNQARPGGRVRRAQAMREIVMGFSRGLG
jgi:hypothetical protein